MNTHYKTIEEVITTILKTLSVSVDSVEQQYDEKMKTMRFQVSSPDSRLLIGEHGTRLQALNYIVKKIVEQKREKGEVPPDTSIIVDVNNYETKRLEELRTKAGMIAERARYFRTSMPMEPMSAYERLVIHAEFTNAPDIRTESSGKGPDRHVVIYFDEKKNVSA